MSQIRRPFERFESRNTLWRHIDQIRDHRRDLRQRRRRLVEIQSKRWQRGSCRAADEFHSRPERCCRLLANSRSSMRRGMGGVYPNELRYPKVQKVTPAVPAATHQALAPPSGKLSSEASPLTERSSGGSFSLKGRSV